MKSIIYKIPFTLPNWKSKHQKEVEKLNSQIQTAERKARVYENLMYFRTNLLRYDRKSFALKDGFLLYNGSVVSFERPVFLTFQEKIETISKYSSETLELFNKLEKLEEECYEAIRTGQDDLKRLENLWDEFHDLLTQVNKISAQYI